MKHRGPNQQGDFICKEVSLGAVRLRILDLAGGDQPFFSEDGNVVLVFNGEVFNYREIRAELEREGYKFVTQCDTEVVLKAFLRWGTNSFARLRGMFAFAVWQRKERRLILVRDRMGIKPLYYAVQNGEFYFGSELKVILQHPEIEREICLDGLNCFLSLNYVPGPYTLIKGIRKLMPGDMLEWTGESFEIRSYVPRGSAELPPKSIDEGCERLEELLRKSIKEQLVSDVPLGIWASGGLDSSTILHYAAELSDRPLHTFSITFRGRSFDESNYIKDVATQYRTRHEEFDLTEDADLVGAIEQIAYYSDEPSADAGAIPVWFLSQMTKGYVTVILSGEGADELFGGYLTYKANRYAASARLMPSLLRKGLLSAANGLPVSDEKIGFEYKLKRFLTGTLMSPERAHVFWNGTFSENEKRAFFKYANAAPMSGVLATMNGTGLQRYLAFDQRYYLPDDILYKVDRMSMAHSLEARPPFLDPRIVDFAAALPDNFKIRGTTTKYLLRQLMNRKLPKSVLTRPKMGFDIPIHQWFRGVLREFLLETLSPENVEKTGLFRADGVHQLISDHLERKSNVGYHLWGLLVLLVWMKRWNVSAPSEIADVSFRGLPKAAASSSS
jgi:asparagine synthase (glutamine-hydrolysing)